ncbi:hypothetical protein RDWZM_002370 [Blomia tropicalis]|uniref:Uncharacterized protein n=1 Tax=Blomia tropicalis TaxID=40697 RepID=A0A9Q0RRN7_BLOTA|nr:hypothetical protein RDWZM_002370 [Blomia tropicalis]
MIKYVTKEGKKLLQSTIQSTNSQNKILEQKLMWDLYESKRTGDIKQKRDNENDQRRKLNDRKRKRTNDSISISDCSDEPSLNEVGDKYWLKKLIKEESKQPDRWDHTGFKELYPEEFPTDHDSSDSSSSDEVVRKPKKKCKKKSKSKKHKKEKKKKSKKKSSHKKQKKKD